MRKLLILFALGMLIVSCLMKAKKGNSAIPTDFTRVQLELTVDGMTCDGCEMTIEKGLIKEEGIVDVKADHERSSAIITLDTTIIDRNKVIASIEELGYSAR